MKKIKRAEGIPVRTNISVDTNKPAAATPTEEVKRVVEAVDIVANPMVAESGSPEIPKLSASEIRERMKGVDPSAVASEVMGWLIANVENYIDNTQRMFRLVLTVTAEGMPHTKTIQDLYMAVTDDEDVGPVLDELDMIVAQAKGTMMTDKTGLAKLFERLIFFRAYFYEHFMEPISISIFYLSCGSNNHKLIIFFRILVKNK